MGKGKRKKESRGKEEKWKMRREKNGKGGGEKEGILCSCNISIGKTLSRCAGVYR